MSKSSELINLIDKYEKSKDVPVINSQDEYNSKLVNDECLPKYATINCGKLFIDFYGYQNHDVINNWDFTKCELIQFHNMKNVIISNKSLCNDGGIQFSNCKYIECINYPISKIENCTHCSFDSSMNIEMVSNSNNNSIAATEVYEIKQCNHCNINISNIPRMTKCECCTIIIDNDEILTIEKHIFKQCNHCNIIIHPLTICENCIICDSEYTLIDFKYYVLHGDEIFNPHNNKNTKLKCQKDCEYVLKN